MPHPSSNHHRSRLVCLASLLIVLASCSTSVGTTDRDTTPPSTTTASSAPSTTRGKPVGAPIDWNPCVDKPEPFQCATINVPVDHAKPNGATLQLALVKLPATDQTHKIGPLLVNPGGPGGSGIEFVEGNFWAPELTRNFDIIGFDPRGVGESSPLHCGDLIAKMYSVDPAPRTKKAVTALESISKRYVAGCARNGGDLLAHMSTRDVARDMDDIRVALGVDKISYLGYSYGTSIGQVYADLFPTRIRAMVLDGVVRLGQSGIDAATDQGIAFDKVLDAFFARCRIEDACTIRADPRKVFTTVRDRLRKGPMPTKLDGRSLTIGQFHLGVGQALYSTTLWPTLAGALDAANHGDGTQIQQLADQYLGRTSEGTYSNQTDVYFAVSCLDWDWPSNPNAFIQAGRRVAAKSPDLAEGIVTDYIRCAYWPTPPQPLTPPKAKGSPLIVVVSTTNDPATPYSNGVDLAKELPDGALITKVGDTHTAYGQGNACVDNAVNAYLISLRPPATGLRCT